MSLSIVPIVFEVESAGETYGSSVDPELSRTTRECQAEPDVVVASATGLG